MSTGWDSSLIFPSARYPEFSASVTIPNTTDIQDGLLGGLYLGLILLVGYTILSAILRSRKRHGVELVGISFALGSGVISLLLFCVSLAGRTPDRATLVCIALVAVATLAGVWYRKGVISPATIDRQSKMDSSAVLGMIAAALILLVIFGVSSHTGWPVMKEIDAFAIWMLKAKWVMLKPLVPIPPELNDPALSYSHQDYPLGFPLLITGLFAAVGRLDDRLARIVLLSLYLSLIAVIYGAVRRIHRRAIALVLTAIFAAAPALTQSAGVAVPESFLILTYGGSIALLLRWMDLRERCDLILSALLLAVAAFIKNEGLALLPVVAVATLCWAGLQRNRQALIDWLCAAAVSLITILPWLIYRTHLPRTHEDYGGKLTDPSVLLHNFNRLGYVLPEYLSWFFSAARVGFLWYLLIIAAALCPGGFRRGPVLVLWFILLIQLGLYLASFMVTPWDVHILVPLVTPRLLSQASPLAVLLIALHLRELRWSTTQLPTQAGV